jgi:hypothetical protein
LLGALIVAVVASMAGVAEGRDRLVVRRALVLPERGLVMFDVRCAATPRRCAGTLRATTIDGVAITTRRRLRLPSAGSRRVALRLRSDGLRTLASAGPEALGEVVVTDRRGRSLSADVIYDARVSCRTGSTLAATASVRVFRLLAFGVYACARPTGRPALMTSEDFSLVLSAVEAVRIAGPFVAFSTTSAWKCSGSAVYLFDLGARRVVRVRRSQMTVDSLANGCTGSTAIVALVLRPSGAMAWTEAPGDAGQAAVRALDNTGDRTLDIGPNVGPTSLRLVGPDEVSWTRGGQVQTAPLR